MPNCSSSKPSNIARRPFPSAIPPRPRNCRPCWAARSRSFRGDEGLIKLATLPGADIVLIAIVGTAGLQPALAAIRAGKDIAVASKEILVMAGEIVMREAREHGVRVLAVDSEHSAIFQCLDGKPAASVRALWLTASGGPFRATPREEFSAITVERALKHPSWVMGRKITIDSATLFNKGLEMIEARWLFDIEMGRVQVVVHPQSVVHSLVEFVDGSIIAQLSTPGHVPAHSIRLDLSRPRAERAGANRSGPTGATDLRAARPGAISRPQAGAAGGRNRRHTPGRVERRQRSRRGRLPRPAASIFRRSAKWLPASCPATPSWTTPTCPASWRPTSGRARKRTYSQWRVTKSIDKGRAGVSGAAILNFAILNFA